MKVKRLKLTSFRGISELMLEFDTDQPTVLIGTNGVGKSSILDCLAILLSHFVARLQFIPNLLGEQPDGENTIKPYFSREDIKNGHKETHNEITVLCNSQEVTWSLSTIENKSVIQPSSRELEETVDAIRKQVEDNTEASLPLVVYYPVNRTVVDISLNIQKGNSYLFEQLAAYNQALTDGKIDFKTFFSWFRTQEDLENEERREKHAYRDHQLEAVRQAIVSLLPEFSNLRVRRSPLRMTVEKQGQDLVINQLSDGEKGLLALAGDLARRLAIANPGLVNPLQGSGVVLIDEIELHLHPAWQRGIIPALRRTFPNCQFILTTHSPQVISDVKPNGIYILIQTPEGIIAKRPESSFGRDSNRILEDLMGVPERPQEIKDHLRDLFRLIDSGHLAEARQLQRQIENQIGDDEPEFASADILIRRREILGR